MALLPPHVAAGRTTVDGPIGSAQVVLGVWLRDVLGALNDQHGLGQDASIGWWPMSGVGEAVVPASRSVALPLGTTDWLHRGPALLQQLVKLLGRWRQAGAVAADDAHGARHHRLD